MPYMTLTPKLKYRLVIRLAELFPEAGNSKAVVLQAGINAGYINFEVSQNDRWQSIVSEAEKQDSLNELIEHIIKNVYRQDSFLQSIHALLSANYSTKLDLLAKAIKRGQCILFLGPGVLLHKDATGTLLPFKQALARRLARDLESKQVYYDKDEQDNLNYIAQRYSHIPNYVSGEQGVKAADFYKSNSDRIERHLFDLLAQLHFPIIVNTNPDDNLALAIQRRGDATCSVRHYSTANNPQARKEQLDKQQRSDRLLYNVLGTFSEPLSILTTESQLLNFTTRILREDPPLDPAVLGAFDDHKYYLFLGFDFEQWYMKIMFETVLKLVKKSDRSFSIHSSNGRPPADISSLELYEEEFKFFFINEDIEVFLSQLVRFYQDI